MRPAPFEMNAQGTFDDADLEIVWRDEPALLTAELQHIVRRVWREQLEQARQRGTHLFNGRLVRYLRHELHNGHLRIEVGETDYAHFISTNYLNWQRGDEFGWHQYGNPVGTSASLITCDGWIVLGRRNDKVACHAGFVHSLGGGLEAADRGPDGRVDAFASTRRELHEEAGVGSEDYLELTCLGLIRDPFIRQPELVFDAVLRLTRAEVTRRMRTNDDEHMGVEVCLDAPEAIEEFIRRTPRMAPIAVGALCLHGRRRFGEQWFKDVLGRLPPPAPPTDSEPQDRAGFRP